MTDRVTLVNVLDQTDSESKLKSTPEEVDEKSQVNAKCLTIHFSLSLENGDIVDSNFDQEPASFVAGDGSMMPSFEAVLEGMKEGEEKEVRLPPEQAFGLGNDDNIQDIPSFQFPADLTLEPGLMVAFADQSGYEQAGMIKEIGKTDVTVDFNHPLAGRTIVFRVQLIKSEEVSE